jgi:hypothetical protein
MFSFFLPFFAFLTLHRTFVKEVLPSTVSACSTNALCLSDKVALLQNQRVGLVDPDTPDSAKTKTAADGTKMNLVLSVAMLEVQCVCAKSR